MTIFGENMLQARKARGLSQRAAALKCGISQQMWSKLETGVVDPSQSKEPVKIAEAFGMEIRHIRPLSSGVPDLLDNMELVPKAFNQATPHSVRAFHPEDPAGDEDIRIPEERLVRLAGGPGHHAPIYETVEDSEPATYRQSWFQKERINPDKTKRFRITGRSMEPMLFPNDTVLVNLQETEVRDGYVYAVAQGGAMRVKVLFRQPDGMLLRSVNWQEYPDEIVKGPDLDEFVVIGRVRDRSGRGGLAGVLPDLAVPQPGRIGGGMDKNIMREIVELVERAFPSAPASIRANLIAELYEMRRENPEIPTERLLRIVKIAS